MELEFVDFQVEASENCTFDFVEIRQGINKDGKLIGRLCGVGKPGIIKSSDSLWIMFASDSSISLPGFKANYTISGKLSNSELLVLEQNYFYLRKIKNKVSLTQTWLIIFTGKI